MIRLVRLMHPTRTRRHAKIFVLQLLRCCWVFVDVVGDGPWPLDGFVSMLYIMG